MADLKINTYPMHIGDWRRETCKLSLSETGAFLRLVHKYIENGTLDRSLFEAYAVCGARMKSQPWLWRDRDWARPYMAYAVRLSVFERDGYQCQYCGTQDGPFEVDHIHPVSRGGSEDFDNLACACISCNRSKGAKLVSEWRCNA